MHLSTSPTTATPAGKNSGASIEEGGRARSRSKDELMDDVRNLVRDGEALLRNTTNLSSEALAQARNQFRGQLGKARESVDAASRAAVARGRKAAVATDKYVHANPWPAIGTAAAAGLLIGVLLARR